MDILQHIPTGYKNRISTQKLLSIYNCSERALRRKIEDARDADYPICSSHKGGYYLAECDAELLHSIRTMTNRGNKTNARTKSQRAELNKTKGQQKLELEEIYREGE